MITDQGKKRKPISKRIRFEVFKRDKFTCQYCGGKAPDFILTIDHIKPICEGGTNSILNLVTSCSVCNSGKGPRVLTNSKELDLKREQIEQRQERVEQLKMLYQWEEELLNVDHERTQLCSALWTKLTGCTLTAYGLGQLGKLLSKYGDHEVITSMKISVENYFIDSERKTTADLTFDKIGRICYVRKREAQNPLYGQAHNVKSILLKRFPDSGYKSWEIVKKATSLLEAGLPFEQVKSEACRAASVYQFLSIGDLK